MLRGELLENGVVQVVESINRDANDRQESSAEGNGQKVSINDARGLLRASPKFGGIWKRVKGLAEELLLIGSF